MDPAIPPLALLAEAQPALRLAAAALIAAGLARALGLGRVGATLAALVFAGSGPMLAALDAAPRDLVRVHGEGWRLPESGTVGLLLLFVGGVLFLRAAARRDASDPERGRRAAAAVVGVAMVLTLALWQLGGLESVNAARKLHDTSRWCPMVGTALWIAALATHERARGLRARDGIGLLGLVAWSLADSYTAPWLALVAALAVALVAGDGLERAARPARIVAALVLVALVVGGEFFASSLPRRVDFRADPADGLVGVVERPPMSMGGGDVQLVVWSHPGLPVDSASVRLEHAVGSAWRAEGIELVVELDQAAARTADAPHDARVWRTRPFDPARLAPGTWRWVLVLAGVDGQALGQRVVAVTHVAPPLGGGPPALVLLALGLALVAWGPAGAAWPTGLLALTLLESAWLAEGTLHGPARWAVRIAAVAGLAALALRARAARRA